MGKNLESFLLQLFTLAFCFYSCHPNEVKLESALNRLGKNKWKAQQVIAHYKKMGDPLRLKAAYYLIENLPDQFHYEGPTVSAYERLFGKIDSLKRQGVVIDYAHIDDSLKEQLAGMPKNMLTKVSDIDRIDANFLIQNIEAAFKAWNYPWARHLSFESFCENLLPYKVRNEKPENWKQYFQSFYRGAIDTIRNETDVLDMCKRLNDSLKRSFSFADLNFPYDVSFTDLRKLGGGRCPEEVQMATYLMRSLGLAVVWDYVPVWANRNNRHDWNGLVDNAKTIAFLGTEINPGVYKIEFPMPGSVRSRRAKIFRHTYAEQSDCLGRLISDPEEIPPLLRDTRYADVTSQYVPVQDVTVSLSDNIDTTSFAYICVFNNLDWQPVFWGRVQNRSATFKDMGTEIVYLPAKYQDGKYEVVGDPFLLQKNGNKKFFRADLSKKISLKLDRKYPAGDDNLIVKGQTYELMYWDNGWHSLGKQVAQGNEVNFSSVPSGTLLWCRNLDEGRQERIFSVENGKINWW